MNGKGGPPLGNNNATKTKIWSLAIQKAIRKRSKSEQLEELEIIADALLNKCIEGDMVAIKELGDRLEGKANQSIDTRVTNVASPSRDVDDTELSGIVAAGSGSGTTGETDSTVKH